MLKWIRVVNLNLIYRDRAELVWAKPLCVRVYAAEEVDKRATEITSNYAFYFIEYSVWWTEFDFIRKLYSLAFIWQCKGSRNSSIFCQKQQQNASKFHFKCLYLNSLYIH